MNPMSTIFPTPHRSIRPSLFLAALLSAAGCSLPDHGPHWPRVGDPNQGAIEIERSACGSCHMIAGVQHADGLVGPPLTHFARRTIVAGLLPNTPDNLVRWVRYPQEVVAGNAMPDGNLTDKQARDIAAYLYTLR
jgi:cytochrome c